MGVIRQWVSGDGNGLSATSWNPNGAPGSGDSLILDGYGSQVPWSSGLDISGVDVRHVISLPTYRGGIGVSGNPLIVQLQSVTDPKSRGIFRGSGDVYVDGDTGNFADLVFASEVGGRGFFSGSLRYVFGLSGVLDLLSTCRITSGLFIDGRGADVTLRERDSVEANPELICQWSGVFKNYRTMDPESTTKRTLAALGGTWYQYGNLPNRAAAPAAPPYHLITSEQSNFKIRFQDALGGSDNPDVFCGGVLDLSDNFQDVVFGSLVLGRRSVLLGAPSTQGTPGPLDVNIDLREDIP